MTQVCEAHDRVIVSFLQQVQGDVPVTSLTQLEHRETYGQAQGRSGGPQGSSVNRQYQLSFVGRLWYRRSPLPQGNRLLLNVSVRYRPG